MSSPSDPADELAQLASCYSTWGQRYFDDYYGAGAPYPPVHVELVRATLAEKRPRHLLDAGCGPASCLRLLIDLVPECWGFDLTPEMVEEAKRVMAALGHTPSRFVLGSVMDPSAFRPDGAPADGFDAVTCVGVMTHLSESDEAVALRNLHDALSSGGVAIVEARNALFSLFTMNRYTHEFIRDRLMRVSQSRSEARAFMERAAASLASTLRTDLPPIRGGKAGEPGYDEIRSRTHVPFELVEAMQRTGFVDVACRFCHFHAAPPMTESMDPATFRQSSLLLEAHPQDWRGHFLASQFIVTGRRP